MPVVQSLLVFVGLLGVSSSAAPPRYESATEPGQIVAHVSSSHDDRFQSFGSSTGEEKQLKTQRIVTQPDRVIAHVSHSGDIRIQINDGQDAHEALLTEVQGPDGAESHGAVEVTHETNNMVRETFDKNEQLASGSIMHVALVSLNAGMLSALAFGVCYVLKQLAHTRSATVLSQATCLRSQIPVLSAILIYFVCSVSTSFAQHDEAAVHLSPMVPTFLIYILKLVIALAMYRGMDGSFADLGRALVDNKSAVLSYALPGACLAIYDALSFVAMAHIAPARYQVLIHLKAVASAFCWQFVMTTWLSKKQWGALMSCVFAALLTERSTVGDIVGSHNLMSLVPFAILGVMIAMNITGNLANEYFLKRAPLTVSAQNAILYTWGSICMIIATSILTITNGPVFKAVDFPKVLAPSVVMSILTISSMGIAASYTIKLSSNVTKEVVGMVVTVTIAAVDWGVLAISPWGFLDVQAVLMCSLGILLFSLLSHQKKIEQHKATEQGGCIEQQKPTEPQEAIVHKKMIEK